MRMVVLMIAAAACSQPSDETKSSKGSATSAPSPTPIPGPHATAVKVTILSTMLSGPPGKGIGEWGFAALVEVDGARLLVDTGARPETVLSNAAELNIDLATVTDVVLTHAHGDHTGGLITLRRELAKRVPSALSHAHVGTDFFAVRVVDGKEDDESELRTQYESLGGTFIEHAAPTELAPQVWFTGPVPRPNSEHNWSGLGKIRRATGLVDDTVPEDSSLVIDTADGLVVITGCGHAGIINIAEYAMKFRGSPRVSAVIGGLHLFPASDEQLTWTGRRLEELGVEWLLGAHCTGIEAVFRLRELLGRPRGAVVVGAVGATFTLGKGIDPLPLAH